VRQKTPIFEPVLRVADVPLRDLARGPTFFVRHGEWLPLGCWGAGAVLALRRRFSGAGSRAA
jgi:hypothetical protein